MKIIEIINEVFDSDVNGKIIRATNDLFTTEAAIGNRRIVFNASMFEDNNGTEIWEIEFTERVRGVMTYDKTGSGNEMQVFSFVIASIKELISRYKPAQIEFSSHKEDGNRSNLYRRMINKIKIPGYHSGETLTDKYTDIFRIIRDK